MAKKPKKDAAEEAAAAGRGRLRRRPRRKSKKKLIIIAAAAVLLLGGGGGGGYFWSCRKAGAERLPRQPAAAGEPAPPSQAAGLRRPAGHAGQPVRPNVRQRPPAISQGQDRARTVRPQAGGADPAADAARRWTPSRPICANCAPTDLDGSAGLYRLKEELTRRVNVAVYPVQGQRRAVQGNRGPVTATAMADQSTKTHCRRMGLALEASRRRTAPAETATRDRGRDGPRNGRAMVDDGQRRADKAGAERILNQDEIDNLLGFSLAEVALDDNSGIRAIIDSAMVSYERLPMLEIVFDRLVRLMTTILRNFTSDNVEVSLDRITSVRFGDYINSIPLPAILAVFKAEEWDNFGLVTVNSSLIYSIIDVLLGGRRGQTAVRIEGRPYTTIETNLVKRMIEVVLADAEQAFKPLSPVQLQHRPAGDQSALRRDLAAGQRRHPGAAAHRHGRPRRHDRDAAALRDDRADPRASCCRCSWARSSAATRSGKAISPPRSGRRRSTSTPCCTRRKLPLRQMMELEGRRHADARHRARRARAAEMRRRAADRRPHGPRRRQGRRARRRGRCAAPRTTFAAYEASAAGQEGRRNDRRR